MICVIYVVLDFLEEKEVNMPRKLKDVTVQFVSLVSKGANRKKFYITKEADQKEPNVEFVPRNLFKKDDPEQLVYGVVYEPDIADSHEDIMDSKEIEKMAHEFLVNYRLIDKQHNRVPGAGDVVESFIAPDDFQVGKEVITKGSWILVTKAEDETWAEIQDGTFTGYSMAGWAENVEEIDDKSAVKKNNVFIKIAKALNIKITKDFESELSNVENNDVFRYIYIAERAIDEIEWTEDDPEIKRNAIIVSLEQLTSKVRTMTFVRKSDEQGENVIPTKEEIMKALNANESIKKAVVAELAKEAPAPVVEPVVEPVAEPVESETTPEITPEATKPEPVIAEKAETEVGALREELSEVKKSVEELTKALLHPKSEVGIEDQPLVNEQKIGIFSKSL